MTQTNERYLSLRSSQSIHSLFVSSIPMVKAIELRLIPAPGQKAEFLAQMEPTSSPPWWESSSEKFVVLEGYTRDEWALDTATQWHSVQVKSIDGRNKLPGFVNYLRERKKTAFGRFGGDSAFVVSHKQMSNSTLACRVAPISTIPNCPFKPKIAAPPVAALPPKVAPAPPAAAGAKKKKGLGLLGNLVAGQQRTNQQVETAATKKASTVAVSTPAATAPTGNNTPEVGIPAEELKTAGQVLSEFRQEMEQEMLDFDISPEPLLKVKISVAEKLKLMTEEEKQSGRVTMEILKYIVYEQAEEVNEEWIAFKEPSEFMDEVTIAIYKEGEAPPEVLEDVNKAELPDEIRGQQQALVQERARVEAQRANKIAKANQKEAMKGEEMDDFATLNSNKRDRRTIEDFEREKRQKLE